MGWLASQEGLATQEGLARCYLAVCRPTRGTFRVLCTGVLTSVTMNAVRESFRVRFCGLIVCAPLVSFVVYALALDYPRPGRLARARPGAGAPPGRLGARQLARPAARRRQCWRVGLASLL